MNTEIWIDNKRFKAFNNEQELLTWNDTEYETYISWNIVKIFISEKKFISWTKKHF